MDKTELYSEDWYEYFTQKNTLFIRFKRFKNGTQITLPEYLFKDTMNIDMGDISFNLLYFGKCHSESDILIYSMK